MRLRIFAPTSVEVDRDVTKVAVHSRDGAFTMLDRHVDTVAVLAQGLLSFVDRDGAETFVAIDGGTVVKVGDDVLVSTPNAVAGADLATMRQTVDEVFAALDVRERAARTALGRLEVDVVQRMVELEEHER